MNSTNKITNYMMHGSSGASIRREHWVEWVLEHQGRPGAAQENGFLFGSLTHYTWEVEGKTFSIPTDKWMYSAQVLPDQSGFIGFHDSRESNNGVLLDAYGNERMRLSVPWHLTRQPTPESAKYPTRFIGLTTPWDNPSTGEEGKFAVLAWVEHAGDYAFELDWQTGQFKWGYFLERG